MIKMNNIKHKGFTLAETLITLVIIGVVAALTVPTMINNHRKAEVETRLKAAYSILANMFKAAEADNGTFGTWDFSEWMKESSSREVVLDAFMNRYMLPYLKIASDKTTTFEALGYKKIISPDGSDYQTVTTSKRFLILANGLTMWMSLGAITLSNNQVVTHSLYINLDIDGPNKGPNTLGKDIFGFSQRFVNGSPLLIIGEDSPTTCAYSGNKDAAYIQNYIQEHKCTFMTNRDTGAIIYTNLKQSREDILNKCKIGNYYAEQCGALIKIDGWRISDDYPWL